MIVQRMSDGNFMIVNRKTTLGQLIKFCGDRLEAENNFVTLIKHYANVQ